MYGFERRVILNTFILVHNKRPWERTHIVQKLDHDRTNLLELLILFLSETIQGLFYWYFFFILHLKILLFFSKKLFLLFFTILEHLIIQQVYLCLNIIGQRCTKYVSLFHWVHKFIFMILKGTYQNHIVQWIL